MEIDYQNARLQINTQLSDYDRLLYGYSQNITMKFLEGASIKLEIEERMEEDEVLEGFSTSRIYQIS